MDEVIKMNELPKYYTALFNATTNAVEALRNGSSLTAERLLVEGQRLSEELYIRETEEKSGQEAPPERPGE